MNHNNTKWGLCPKCKGQGKKSRRIRKKVKLRYQAELSEFEKNNNKGKAPEAPKRHLDTCIDCNGSGLIYSEIKPILDTENYPNIAIIGAGIGGVALAVACLHRGIPFTIYERDDSFDARSQGYGLTLQQASKAIKALGISSLKKGIVSTRHIVHNTKGEIIGEWGMRKWLETDSKPFSKRTNIHIARQSLRLDLLEQLGGENKVKWNHQLVDFKENEQGIQLNFKVNGKLENTKADLIVGADGIRSKVRNLIIGEQASPLRYLGCMVILGICPLSAIQSTKSPLLDSATVFQTANGKERIYMMPFDSDSVMWQLSFPISEKEAKNLNIQGPKALKKEALKRTQWHEPIPQILSATLEDKISGYPVYDRELLSSKLLEKKGKATLIGDAAHPMSPFKGQGANQALLDALVLARSITKACRPLSSWKNLGIRESVLKDFESEMISRSASKVKGSAQAADFLHSEIVLRPGNEPRGRCLTREKNKE